MPIGGLDVIGRGASDASVEGLCSDLLSERGEASGTAIARDLVDAYSGMNEEERLEFFQLLATKFSPDVDAVVQAAEAYRDAQNPDTLIAIVEAVEPPRQELIRRINMAPRGTAAIVAMREQLLKFLKLHPDLRAVDADFQHLLRSWFNRGFLELRRIDWSTPAATLEKLFKYEAVHEIQGWPDMRRRLEEDRRCFAFFHPALPDEPLIFVEVALLEGVARSIEPLLDLDAPTHPAGNADTAVFYSINNCQAGLRAISFGNFLIKQVVADLRIEQPRLKTFVTLSPVPKFRAWLDTLVQAEDPEIDDTLAKRLPMIDEPGWHRQDDLSQALQEPLMRLCARFLLEPGRRPDPVSTFHLRNGASVDRINWLADTSEMRMRQSAGIMVNYMYRLSRIEQNHENFVNERRVAASSAVKDLRKKKKK